MKKTIGKNTLGDGKKMQIAFNNYERSNHNLSYVWRNTQAPGTLVPFMKVLAMPGDTFDIDIESHILTHPTVGPLFGSYKFQADVFVCPIRLYNALLHNNALNIGLNMSKVKFLKFNLDMTLNTPVQNTNPSSLLNYLGIKSKGKEMAASGTGADQKMNAIPAIAYYDIFKNFYANKQEEKFYVLGQDQQYILKNPNELTSDYNLRYKREDSTSTVLINDNTFANKLWGSERNVYLYIKTASNIKTDDFYIEYKINNNTERSAIRSALFDEGVIDGCDDYLYLMGNNAVTMYRYQISTNTWTTLSPGVARGAAPAAGLSGHWIWGNTDSTWRNESSILNGRRIYSFRAGGGAVLDYYDIPSNAWTNTITWSPNTTVFGAGTKYSIISGRYIWIQKDATNRWYRFDTAKNELDPGGQFLYPQGAAVTGDTCFDVSYTDGATSLTWIYMVLNTSQVMLRMLLI